MLYTKHLSLCNGQTEEESYLEHKSKRTNSSTEDYNRVYDGSNDQGSSNDMKWSKPWTRGDLKKKL